MATLYAPLSPGDAQSASAAQRVGVPTPFTQAGTGDANKGGAAANGGVATATTNATSTTAAASTDASATGAGKQGAAQAGIAAQGDAQNAGAGAGGANNAAGSPSGATAAAAAPLEEWSEHMDEKYNRSYFYNADRKEAIWERPKSGRVTFIDGRVEIVGSKRKSRPGSVRTQPVVANGTDAAAGVTPTADGDAAANTLDPNRKRRKRKKNPSTGSAIGANDNSDGVSPAGTSKPSEKENLDASTPTAGAPAVTAPPAAATSTAVTASATPAPTAAATPAPAAAAAAATPAPVIVVATATVTPAPAAATPAPATAVAPPSTATATAAVAAQPEPAAAPAPAATATTTTALVPAADDAREARREKKRNKNNAAAGASTDDKNANTEVIKVENDAASTAILAGQSKVPTGRALPAAPAPEPEPEDKGPAKSGKQLAAEGAALPTSPRAAKSPERARSPLDPRLGAQKEKYHKEEDRLGALAAALRMEYMRMQQELRPRKKKRRAFKSESASPSPIMSPSPDPDSVPRPPLGSASNSSRIVPARASTPPPDPTERKRRRKGKKAEEHTPGGAAEETPSALADQQPLALEAPALTPAAAAAAAAEPRPKSASPKQRQSQSATGSPKQRPVSQTEQRSPSQHESPAMAQFVVQRSPTVQPEARPKRRRPTAQTATDQSLRGPWVPAGPKVGAPSRERQTKQQLVARGTNARVYEVDLVKVAEEVRKHNRSAFAGVNLAALPSASNNTDDRSEVSRQRKEETRSNPADGSISRREHNETNGWTFFRAQPGNDTVAHQHTAEHDHAVSHYVNRGSYAMEFRRKRDAEEEAEHQVEKHDSHYYASWRPTYKSHEDTVMRANEGRKITPKPGAVHAAHAKSSIGGANTTNASRTSHLQPGSPSTPVVEVNLDGSDSPSPQSRAAGSPPMPGQPDESATGAGDSTANTTAIVPEHPTHVWEDADKLVKLREDEEALDAELQAAEEEQARLTAAIAAQQAADGAWAAVRTEWVASEQARLVADATETLARLRPSLGIVALDGFTEGVKLTRVSEGMAGDAAGLRVDDVVLRIVDHPVNSNADLRDALKTHCQTIGSEVNFRIRRDDAGELNLVVRVGALDTRMNMLDLLLRQRAGGMAVTVPPTMRAHYTAFLAQGMTPADAIKAANEKAKSEALLASPPPVTLPANLSASAAAPVPAPTGTLEKSRISSRVSSRSRSPSVVSEYTYSYSESYTGSGSEREKVRYRHRVKVLRRVGTRGRKASPPRKSRTPSPRVPASSSSAAPPAASTAVTTAGVERSPSDRPHSSDDDGPRYQRKRSPSRERGRSAERKERGRSRSPRPRRDD